MTCTFGVKVNLLADFGVVKETLERMGILNKTKKVITPTCYIYQEFGEYYVCHFKELLSAFDDVPDTLSEKDTDRRNSICTMLENWGLIECVDKGAYQDILKEKISILLYKDKIKYDYDINHKFMDFIGLTELRSGL